MKDPASTVPPERTAPLTDALVATLRTEAEALDDLNALLEEQLDALRAGTPAVLEEAAVRTHECATTLDELRQKRTRQKRLLVRVLRLDGDGDPSLTALAKALGRRSRQGQRLAEVRVSVRERAQEARRRGESLSFALEYAADLNRDLLLAMQHTGPERGTYTAAGHAQPSTDRRSFVNTIG